MIGTTAVACGTASLLHTWRTPAACSCAHASPTNNAWVTATSTLAAPAASARDGPRPGKGLAPKHLPDVIGRRAARDLKRGTAVDWTMLASSN